MELNNAIDIYGLIEYRSGNPNGDPDTDNAPRQDPETGLGFMTSMAIKRKLRDFVGELYADKDNHQILYRQGTSLNKEIDGAAESVGIKKKGDSKGKADKKLEAQKEILRKFWDVRAFGGVLSTGFDIGCITGPIQFEEAWSLHPIEPTNVTITRCVGTKEGEEKTMGNKWIIPYGLYEIRGHICPVAARKSNLTIEDVYVFLEAFQGMCNLDKAAARPYSALRYLNVFTHKGLLSNTVGKDGRQLFDLVNVRQVSEEAPRRFEDFEVAFDAEQLPEGTTSVETVGYSDPEDLLGINVIDKESVKILEKI